MNAPRLAPLLIRGCWLGLSTILVLGVVLVLLLAALASSAWMTDGLLWRFEALEKSPRLSQRAHERLALGLHRTQDALIAPGTVLLFGDSHLAALPVSLLGRAHNFALGGLSAGRLADHFADYASIQRAGGIVLGAGTNDLVEGAGASAVLSAWSRLLAALPAQVPALCVGIPEPAGAGPWPDAIALINRGVQDRCAARGLRFLAITPGRGAWAGIGWAADGVHLDSDGSRLLARLIRASFQREGS
mgnify:CR=1 FL=1